MIKNHLKTGAKTHGFTGPPSRRGTKGYTAREWLQHFQGVSDEEFAQEQVDSIRSALATRNYHSFRAFWKDLYKYISKVGVREALERVHE